MQSTLLLAILVAFGQLGGNDFQSDTPRYPAEKDNAPAAQPLEYPPITPAEGTAAPLDEQPKSTAPATPATTTTTEIKPAELWKALAVEPKTGTLPGSPISLADAVAGATSRGGQTGRVTAYWNLAAALVDYYLALREATELETLRQAVARPSFAWDEARLAQASRIQAAKASAEAAQYRLQRVVDRAAPGGLPLPSDSPHGGAYETRYEENFAGRDSSEALQLSELLPQLHQVLRNEAASLVADQQTLQSVSQQRDPQSDGIALLKTYELLSLRRREFIRAVADYNIQIARYSELATPGQVGTGRLVAMLIETNQTASTPGRNSDITRTSAEEPVNSQPPGQAAPRTFAEEAPPQTQPAPPTKYGAERSILVQPQ